MKTTTTTKYYIDDERYGIRTGFDTLAEAQEFVRGCGQDFATTEFRLRYKHNQCVIVDESGFDVGYVEEA